MTFDKLYDEYEYNWNVDKRKYYDESIFYISTSSHIDPYIKNFYDTVKNTTNRSKHNSEGNMKAKINNVIFNDPATIVFWSDGTKTVVKAHEDDEYDPEKGLAMAIAKKAMGNKGRYYNEFKKWLEKR